MKNRIFRKIWLRFIQTKLIWKGIIRKKRFRLNLRFSNNPPKRSEYLVPLRIMFLLPRSIYLFTRVLLLLKSFFSESIFEKLFAILINKYLYFTLGRAYSIWDIWYPSRAVSNEPGGVRLLRNESNPFTTLLTGWSHQVHQEKLHTNWCHIPFSCFTSSAIRHIHILLFY